MSPSGRSSVGRYELRERLGAGGMGTVWHAWDPALERDVAVKEVILPEGMSPEDRDEARTRTLREARATARIKDNAVVTVHDVLEHEGSPWIVMELLSGDSLQHHLDQSGPLPVARVEEAARSLLSGLKAAHAVGVTHRDVKPANIMLTEDDRTVLTDFGIANVDGNTALTQTGVYIGSPEYMAPERFEGERALPASDLWSLGVTLYALLEGRSPFKRESITGIISAVLTAPMPPRPSVVNGGGPVLGTDPESAPLRTLIEALLNRDVSARPSAAEAIALLDRAKEERGRDGGTAEVVGPVPGPAGPPGGTGGNPGPGPGTGGNTGPGPGAVSGPRPLPGTGGNPAFAAPRGHPTGPHTGGNPTVHGPGVGGGPGHPGPNGPYPGGNTGFGGPGTGSGGNAAYMGPNDPRTAANTAFGVRPGPAGPLPPGRRAEAPLPPITPATPSRTGPHARIDGTTAAHGFGPGTGHLGTAPAARRPSPPASVLVVCAMLVVNALVLLVLTAMAAGDGDTGSGVTAVFGVWGVCSGLAVIGLLLRSRLVYGLVVLMQLVASVGLILSMFTVLIYTPEMLPFYLAMLLFNLMVGGFLLIPPKARAFFRLGAAFE
ncbi:serine/threonine-protein kinase [Nocardiopsis lambiniae]|uniref:non-specific serine/threonine protein kinase n=1 Tax=Nocardiopsis lambiniae TaxID=3075539 RepID=A0ABU2M5H2_9ACTN|nr:serine/threonine-protein kinase [Nocardiopsis sp. DSM 44743]MDT0327888.1 serine/threonine-protein kinase [Nocardiopsis sp. DSM 44743]